jgi:hypothetical protein
MTADLQHSAKGIHFWMGISGGEKEEFFGLIYLTAVIKKPMKGYAYL